MILFWLTVAPLEASLANGTVHVFGPSVLYMEFYSPLLRFVSVVVIAAGRL